MPPTSTQPAITAVSNDASPSSTWRRSAWLFVGLVTANLAASMHTNVVVLTDDVYRAILTGQGMASELDGLLSLSRSWAVIGYIATPFTLAITVGFVALLVQLALLGFRIRVSLSRAFLAALWAQTALTLGRWVRTLWLGALPEAARTGERIGRMPGSVSWLSTDLGSIPPGLSTLLEQVSVYQLGWIALLVLALEERDRVPLGAAASVAIGLWALSVSLRWGVATYLELGGAG